MLLGQVFYFFFSRRRRHTSYRGDWSSDVCSSDLAGPDRPADADPQGSVRIGHRASSSNRSEERRVGKEWRSRWSPYQLQKKRKNLKPLADEGRLAAADARHVCDSPRE